MSSAGTVRPANASTALPVAHSRSTLSERELARLWRDQTFPPEALVTAEGERLRVIYRGRSGGGPGPDFRDALIAAPGGLLQGDVELHVRSSDFQRHGHQRDPAYARVVLHLVFWDDERRRTALPDGGTAPVAALAGWVEGRAAEIARWLERPALWREPCFSALARDGPGQVTATLDRLGDMRFRRKTAALVRIIAQEGEEEALWQSLLEALAFGSDRQAFRLLAQQVRWTPLHARLRTLPASERVAGALRELAAVRVDIEVRHRAAGRPANRRARRLDGAARLAARFAEKGLTAAFLEGFKKESPRGLRGQRGHRETESAKIETNPRRGQGRFRVSKFEFRADKRLRPESETTSSLIAALTVPGLVGRGRAVEIVANAVLPWLAALGPESNARRAEAVFAGLPLTVRYGAVRHLHEAVGGMTSGKGRQDEPKSGEPGSVFANLNPSGRNDGRAALPINFRRQQGMLYLFHGYCTQGGCGRCPLS